MNPYERIAAAAASNDNVVSYAMLRKLKLPEGTFEALLRRRLVQRLHPGVLLVGAAPPTWRQAVRAAVAAAGEAMPSHATFMAWCGIDGAEEGPIEITVVDKRRLDLTDVTVYRSRRGLGPVRRFDGLRVPCIERALLDYAAVAQPMLVERAVEHVLRDRLTTEARIWRGIVEHGGRGVEGTVLLRDVMEHRPEGRPARSVLEIMLGKVLNEAGLAGIRNHPVSIGDRNYEIDRAFLDEMVALEADSRWHVTRAQKAKDAVRQLELESVGYLFIRTGWTEVVSQPGELVARIRAAFQHRAAA